MATPAVASSASASRKRRSPGSPDTSVAMARCGRSSRILPTSWVSTRPGPASTNTRTPAAYMASIWSTKRTGLATWVASTWRIWSGSVGYGSAVVLAQIGISGEATVIDSSTSASRELAVARTGLWKAQATFKVLAAIPSPPAASTTRSTTAVGAGDHRLGGAVVVGHHRARMRVEQLAHGLDGAADGGHGARVVALVGGRVDDGLAPRLAEGEQILGGEDPGAGQRGQLAVAVPAGHRRAAPRPRPAAGSAPARTAPGRAGPPGCRSGLRSARRGPRP